MSIKSSSVVRVDEICAIISTEMQKLKALVRTYAQEPSEENAAEMALAAKNISKHSETVHSRLVNVVSEHKKA